MRLDSLCKTLSLPSDKAKSLRYQLLHRSASAIYEAKRYRTDIAVILVHSFGNPKDGFSDFAAFLRALGADEVTPGTLAGAFPCDGVSLYAGWVQDEAPKGATASAYLDDLRNYAFRLSQWVSIGHRLRCGGEISFRQGRINLFFESLKFGSDSIGALVSPHSTSANGT